MKFKIFVLFVFMAAIIGFSIKMPEILYDITWEELTEVKQTEDGISDILDKIGISKENNKLWAQQTTAKLYGIIGGMCGAFLLVALIPTGKRKNT